MTEQRENLARVYNQIAPAVLGFREVWGTGEPFQMVDLTTYVRSRTPCEIAPDSPGRILRALRQEGSLDYILVSRRSSRYRFR